jgi:hypothetical protein
MSWFNVLNLIGWIKEGVETPVSKVDRLPVDAGLHSTDAVVAQVVASVTPATLLVANANRRGAAIYNTSTTAMLYVSLGGAVSSTLFTVRIDPNGYYELPFNYLGLVSGVFSTALGGANVTELT